MYVKDTRITYFSLRNSANSWCRAFISSIKAKYPDARHHCYAFAVGQGASVTHGMSDDGEPSGTAGRTLSALVSADLPARRKLLFSPMQHTVQPTHAFSTCRTAHSQCPHGLRNRRLRRGEPPSLGRFPAPPREARAPATPFTSENPALPHHASARRHWAHKPDRPDHGASGGQSGPAGIRAGVWLEAAR